MMVRKLNWFETRIEAAEGATIRWRMMRRRQLTLDGDPATCEAFNGRTQIGQAMARNPANEIRERETKTGGELTFSLRILYYLHLEPSLPSFLVSVIFALPDYWP